MRYAVSASFGIGGGDHGCLAGQCGGVFGAAPALGLADDLEWLFMVTRPVTIYGGSSQLQRNLIATRFLGLPAG